MGILPMRTAKARPDPAKREKGWPCYVLRHYSQKGFDVAGTHDTITGNRERAAICRRAAHPLVAMISIVIPTYNEAAVIEQTLRRASAALGATGEDFELVVVDDSSSDGTAELAESIASELPVRVLRRPGRLGLASAVLDGWAIARGEVLGVMDADLQHPPEVLGRLVKTLREKQADLAIASRYVDGGGTSDWTLTRRAISRSATHMAATVLPLKLASLGDPMSGMFLVRASALAGVRLAPLGYKILLELLAKARYDKLVEVPYVFEEREHGSSKLGPRQYFEYLLHLFRLAVGTGQLWSWLRYGIVGLTGALIDLALFYALVQGAGWPPLPALLVAIEAALLSNFIWNEAFTFRSRQASGARSELLRRLLRYEKVCLPGAILNILLTLLLLSRGAGVVVAAGWGIVAGGAYNLLVNIPSIWRTWGRQPFRP
jgi:dolichol-phosphate mannosyltransferase